MYVKTAGMSAYRRRRGMGDVAGPLFTCPTGEQVFRTSDCPGGSPAPDVQQQIADVWSYLGAQQPTAGSTAGNLPPTTVMQWLQLNPVPVMIGAGLIFVAVMFAKAGR